MGTWRSCVMERTLIGGSGHYYDCVVVIVGDRERRRAIALGGMIGKLCHHDSDWELALQ